MDFITLPPPPAIIHPWASEAAAVGNMRTWPYSNLGSQLWSQNFARYFPFTVTQGVTVYKMALMTGSTANGNVDMGIYDSAKNKIVSTGSKTQAAANTLQVEDVTDTYLPPGDYFLAGQSDSATATSMAVGSADELIFPHSVWYVQNVGSFPLPATATLNKSSDASPRFYYVAAILDPNWV